MAKPSRLSQAERTEISDALMLQTAIRLIVEVGPEETTLKDVGELAGFSRGLAGYRFGNKAGLFEFVIRSIGKEWLHELKSATDGLVGYQAITAAIDAYYQMCKLAPDHVAALYTLWFNAIGRQPEIRKVISAIHERRCKDVVNWVEQGIDQGKISGQVDAQAIANLFSTSLIGIVYQWLLKPEDMSTIRVLLDNLKHTVALWLGLHQQAQ